jgi:hypothetical protein
MDATVQPLPYDLYAVMAATEPSRAKPRWRRATEPRPRNRPLSLGEGLIPKSCLCQDVKLQIPFPYASRLYTFNLLSEHHLLPSLAAHSTRASINTTASSCPRQSLRCLRFTEDSSVYGGNAKSFCIPSVFRYSLRVWPFLAIFWAFLTFLNEVKKKNPPFFGLFS